MGSLEIQSILRTTKGGCKQGDIANMGGVAEGLHDTPVVSSMLSSTQQKIYDMLTKDYMTPLQIATRLKKTHQAIYKIIGKLRQKGMLKIGYQAGVAKGVAYHQWGDSWGGLHVNDTAQLQNTFKNHEKRIRLHGQEFNCKLIWSSPQYERLLKDKSIIVHDGNTVRLFRHSVEIYCSPSRSFMGQDVYESTGQSLQYWLTFFNQIESKLNIILIKGGNTRIRQVNGHYAHVNDPLAQECNEKKKKIHIYDQDDGKLKFVIDNSWHLNEAEGVHPEKAEADMEVYTNKIRDFLNPNTPTVTEIMPALQAITQNQTMYAENISSHIQAIKDLGTGVNKLVGLIERMEAKR